MPGYEYVEINIWELKKIMKTLCCFYLLGNSVYHIETGSIMVIFFQNFKTKEDKSTSRNDLFIILFPAFI